MADEAYYLTKRDRDLLDKMHASWSHMFQSSNSPRLDQSDYDNPPQAPECYIALVPEDGIPALEPNVGTGEADFMAGDRPGSAECAIYQIVDGELRPVRSNRKIWNLTETDIPQGWITVVRDKFGTWTPVVGGTPCAERNEIWQISVTGDPRGGSLGITFFINGVEDTVNISWDATAAEAKTSFGGHSELATTDVNVEGGDLPDTSLKVEFIEDQANKPIRLTSFSKDNLSVSPGTGTTGDTEGVGVIVTRWQPGFSL